MFRYIAFAWDALSAPQSAAARQLRSRLGSPWICALDAPGLQVFYIDARDGSPGAHLLAPQGGVVLGTVFTHSGVCQDAVRLRGDFSEQDSAAIINSSGDWLLANCWGNYVAIGYDAQRAGAWALKDPIGTLPCFVTSSDGVAIVFSSISDCCDELELRNFRINRRFLDARLIAGRVTQDIDALHGVTQVRRGECIHVRPPAAVMHRRFSWTPNNFRWADSPITSAKDAEQALRAHVRAAIHNLAECHDEILMQLSGGLDSSIVFAYLFAARPRVAAVTFSSDDGSSDPRPWARTAFERMATDRMTHTEVHIGAEHDPVPEKIGYPSAEPATVLHTAMLRSSIKGILEKQPSTTAIFTGDGGDSLFGSSCLDLAVAAYLARHPRERRSALHIAAQVARHIGSTTWKVFYRAMRARIFGDQAAPMSAHNKQGRQLVAAAVAERLGGEGDLHPWLTRFALGQESKRKIGGLLATPDYYAISPHPATQFPAVVMPLYSQPIVELCLRIPADLLFADGRDRGLARRAFRGHVPAELLDRAWKDRPGDFHQKWLRRNAPWARETLLDGVLVAAGFLDRDATESALSFRPQRSQVFPGEIFQHLETELWARQWRL